MVAPGGMNAAVLGLRRLRCQYRSRRCLRLGDSCASLARSQCPIAQHRSFTSADSIGSQATSSAEHEILTAALQKVPSLGFTSEALVSGAESVGYPPTSLALLTRGTFDLVVFYLVTQRRRLKADLPWHNAGSLGDASLDSKVLKSRLEQTLLIRLRANTPVIQQYANAIAIMSLAKNIPSSIAELGRLSDEILHLSGDTSVDTSWYLKRCAIAGVYATSEAFMTQDQSTDFVDTQRFLYRRLEDVRTLGQGASDIGQYLGFAGISTVNLLRSWNVRV